MNIRNNKDIKFKKKPLAIYVGCFFTGILFTTTLVNALPADLNIYKQPTLGKTTLLVMVDSSAGMDDNGVNQFPERSILKDYPNCAGRAILKETIASLESKYQSNNTLRDSSGRIKPTFVFDMPYCNDGTGENKYSRQDRQKIAMTQLLSSIDISDNIIMGLGQMPTQTSAKYVLDEAKTAQDNMIYSNINKAKGIIEYRYKGVQSSGEKNGTGTSAKILIPAQPLTLAQRWKMRVAVAALYGGGTTPLASGLAESGAYMLGNTTTLSPNAISGKTYQGVSSDAVSGYSNITGYRQGGFLDSNNATKNLELTGYKSPIEPSTATCNSNGIFLLTNAAPTETQRATAQLLMQNALKDPSFVCPVNDTDGLIKAVGSGSNDYGWTCMGAFAKKLYNGENKIKVAIAGFGNDFSPYLASDKSVMLPNNNGKIRKYYKCNALSVGQTYTVQGINTTVTQDTINACNLGEQTNDDNTLNVNGKVGGYGQGGFFPIISPQDLVNGIRDFVADLETALPALNSGLPAIPVDTLNTTQQLPFAYYSQFQPNTTSSEAKGIWLGNIKKYKAVDNTFKDKESNDVIDEGTGNLNSTIDFWSTAVDNADATKGGALAKLPVQTTSGRKIYSNRAISGATVTEITTSGTDLTLIAAKNPTTGATTGTAEELRTSTDPDRAYLLNLLGFAVSVSPLSGSLTGATQLRQMGATLNSTPAFFTTQAEIATKRTTRTESDISVTYNPGDYIDRKNYLLFGTNQGLLQAVNADTGEEKFAFLPKEMIDRQKLGFVAKTLQTSMSDLYAGIDGPWSIYSNYITNNLSNSLKTETLNAYGGLRRGGANYYALDLKNIESGSPKILFKTLSGTAVDPNTGIPTGTCNNTAPLNCMGQSWSKPVIAWIKWKGKPQLVMIVGGGYDPHYDNPISKSDTVATKGNGIYMFAAKSSADTGLTAGDLLWWGSSSAISTTAGNDNTTQKTNNSNLKYSVVSEIKTVDRDSDGFVDNLYFGDLGGQVFRVDINNLASSATASFNVKRIVRIANFITDAERSTKAAPRFYNSPTFTVHKVDGLKGTTAATRFAVIAIGSGDRSSPVSNGLDNTKGIPDRVYGIFDRDVGRTDLYTMASDISATGVVGLLSGTSTVTTMLDLHRSPVTTGTAVLTEMQAATISGWYNTLSGTTLGRTGADIDSDLSDGIARYKVLSSFSAIKNTLFTSYFDAADNGTSSSCSAGIKGRSYIKNYCLPFGNIGADGANCGTGTDGRAFSTALGRGIDVGAGVVPLITGGMSTGSNSSAIGPISGKSGVSAQYKTPLRFEPLSWSEKNT